MHTQLSLERTGSALVHPTWIIGALLSIRLFCTELLLLTLTMAWVMMHIVQLDLSLSTSSAVSFQKISSPFAGFKLTWSLLPVFSWLYLAPLRSGNTFCPDSSMMMWPQFSKSDPPGWGTCLYNIRKLASFGVQLIHPQLYLQLTRACAFFCTTYIFKYKYMFF